MTSSYTPNKDFEEPAPGDQANSWGTTMNSNFSAIDTAFGGSTVISVTGVSGTQTLSQVQYQPPNIEFFGTLSQDLVYVLPNPSGPTPPPGGIWSVANVTSGSFKLSIGIIGGTPVLLPQGFRTLVVSDGNTMVLADDGTATTIANVAAAAALTSANSTSSDALHITLNTIANARLPNPGVGPNTTIASNPGSAPAPTHAGAIWYYY